MKKMLSIALCAAMILSFAASVSASSLRRTLSNKNMPIATSKEDDQPINKVKQPQIPTDWEEKYEYRQKNEVDPQFIQSLQEFGAKTSSLLLTSQTENQSYSPVSFAYALAMLGNGAKGQTAQQIADALGVDTISSSNQQFHKFYNYNYSSEQGNVLKLANSIWVQEDFPLQKDFSKKLDFPLQKDFSKKLAEQFYASAYSVDFSKQSAADAMSKWISEQTAGLLNPTFTPDPMQLLSLINTLYFEGAWSDSFQAANNTTEKFTLADGSQVDATYMNQTFDQHTYYETEDYILFELGFVGGQSMRLVLPKEGKQLNDLLTEPALKAILSSPEESTQKSAKVNLKLPKFSFDSNFNLNKLCQSLGLEELFSESSDLSGISKENIAVSNVQQELPKFSFDSNFNLNKLCQSLGLEELFSESSDLSGISKENIAVSNVQQESHVEIDENGCKAAAYTKIDIREMSLLLDETEEINLSFNRPFLFSIQSGDNAPLFVGTVYQPK